MSRTQRWRLHLLLGFSLVALTGCAAATTEPPALGATCVRSPIRAVLHVDPVDPRGLWATDLATRLDHAVRPRAELGWTVEAGPPALLVDRLRHAAGRDGDIISGACVEFMSSTYVIGPEDLPPPDRPAN